MRLPLVTGTRDEFDRRSSQEDLTLPKRIGCSHPCPVRPTNCHIVLTKSCKGPSSTRMGEVRVKGVPRKRQLLTVAGLLVTLEGLHLHTTESMRRHDDFSVWFACMAAGYTLGCAAQFGKNRYVRIATTALVIVVAVASAVHYTPTGPLAYPAQTNVTQVEAFGVLKPYLELPGGRFLLGGLDDDLMLYTEHLNVPWYQHFDDVYIKYPIPGRGDDSPRGVLGHLRDDA